MTEYSDIFIFPLQYLEKTKIFNFSEFQAFDDTKPSSMLGIEIIDIGFDVTKIPIENSTEDCLFFSNEKIFETLGLYTHESVTKQGKIILFKKCIKEYSKRLKEEYLAYNSITDKEIEDIVYKIVLWHEMGHWMLHWFLDKNGNRWNNDTYRYQNLDDIILHEGIAQTFTCLTIQKAEKDGYNFTKLIFELMCLNQSPQYHKHTEIMKHINFSELSFLNAICEIRKSLRVPLINDLLNNL